MVEINRELQEYDAPDSDFVNFSITTEFSVTILVPHAQSSSDSFNPNISTVSTVVVSPQLSTSDSTSPTPEISAEIISITGTIFLDGTPQEGATVYVLDGEDVVTTETSDSSGVYQIKDLEAGTYHVTAEYENEEIFTEKSKPFLEVT